jgi:hypothetical protein
MSPAGTGLSPSCGYLCEFHQIRCRALTRRHTTAVHCGPIAPGLCAAMLPDAKKYHAYARECLELAEQADSAETRQKLIELSRVWMEAALRELIPFLHQSELTI